MSRLYIVPGLGNKRLDKVTVRDVQTWLDKVRTTCQCCPGQRHAPSGTSPSLLRSRPMLRRGARLRTVSDR